ncbi:MAG: 16S rRNA (adenine(1518)-N(6)/adenine(1519)-N(6))-dimethyltransferase RsmA [Acidimicrobiales bacterium]
MTLKPTEVSALLSTYSIRPSRALGQNFVVDPNTVRRVARLAGVGPGDRVVEIGPGLGALTLAIAETGAVVKAIEVDRHLLEALGEVVAASPYPGSVDVVHADAMKLDWAAVLGPAPGWVLVANLPYNIATPLIANVLDEVASVQRMLVMVQREVGERLAAGVGSPAYGAVSVKVSYWAQAKVVAAVPASVFRPRPNVESVLVDIRRRPAPAVDPAVVRRDDVFALVRAGFATRRKMLRRSLASLVGPAAFAAAGVNPEARAETLDVVDWGRLAYAVLSERAAGTSPGSLIGRGGFGVERDH